MVATDALVTALIPAYNCSEMLRSAIESALGQSYTNVEIIVVDDGSTDRTPEVCAEFKDKIRYVRRTNGGTPAARNTGLKAAAGTYVALLDQDDRWLPTKIEKQVSLIESTPSIGLVHTGGKVLDVATAAVTSTYTPAEELDYHDILAWCKVGCATALMRTKDVLACGGFDESLKGVDDWDMWIRLAWKKRIVGIREVLAEIREHSANQGHNYARMYPFVRRCVQKKREIHPNCRLCSQAIRFARKRIRLDYYVKASRHSKQLWHQGRFTASAVTKALGFKVYPEALIHPLKLLVTKHSPV